MVAELACSAAWLLDALRRKQIIPDRVGQPPDADVDRAARSSVWWASSSRSGGRQPDMFEPQRGPKLAAHDLTFVQFASLMGWLRSFADMT